MPENKNVTRTGGSAQSYSLATTSTILPDVSYGRFINVGTLTANVTIAAPVGNPQPGQELLFSFTQDGSGSRTVTWNAVFKVNWTPTTTSNARNTIEFYFDGTNWLQIGGTVGVS